MVNVVEIEDIENTLLRFLPKNKVWDLMPLLRQKSFIANKPLNIMQQKEEKIRELAQENESDSSA